MSHTISGVKPELHRKFYDCKETRMLKGFARPGGQKPGLHNVVVKEQVTAHNLAISALFRITIGAKFPSQMNPLSQSGVSGIPFRGNPD
jgi:hypothetical protein